MGETLPPWQPKKKEKMGKGNRRGAFKGVCRALEKVVCTTHGKRTKSHEKKGPRGVIIKEPNTEPGTDDMFGNSQQRGLKRKTRAKRG